MHLRDCGTTLPGRARRVGYKVGEAHDQKQNDKLEEGMTVGDSQNTGQSSDMFAVPGPLKLPAWSPEGL